MMSQTFAGKVDFMIHNAGVALRDLAVETELNVDLAMMTTNRSGPVALTRALLPSILERKPGFIGRGAHTGLPLDG